MPYFGAVWFTTYAMLPLVT